MKKVITIIVIGFAFINNVNALTIEEKIDSLKTEVDNLVSTRLDKTYPIGSIYETTTYSTAAEVNHALGGTWEVYGSGKTLVGVDTNDDNFNTINKTGGTSSTTLSSSNLPSHTHSIPALSGTAASAGAHTHSRGTMNITGGFRSRDFNWNTTNKLIFNGWGAMSVANTLATDSTTAAAQNVSKSPYYYNDLTFDASKNWTGETSSNGAHTHNVTTTANTSGSTGSGTSFTNLQPYITVYMYKRVA